MPSPPSTWKAPFRRLADETGLNYETLFDAAEAARRFLDPVLRSEAADVWESVAWSGWTRLCP
jgi:hypothetical protein